jgi:uncharacterized protein (DUF362 family)
MTTGCFTSRRNFLKTTVAGGAAAAFASRLPSAWGADAPSAAAGSSASRVSLAAGDDRANIAFKALEPFRKEIAAAIGKKRVIIKPNNVIPNRPLSATNADNLEGILEFLKSIGKKDVAIAESPAMGSALDGFESLGYNKFVAQYGVKLVDLDKDDFHVVQCIDQKDFQPHPCRMASTMLDPNNFIISAAKLKTHDLVGITLSLKNVVVGSALKDAANRPMSGKRVTHGGGTYGINYNLFVLSAKLHPHLAVIDGYEGMEGTGPVNGTPIAQKVCIASLDWLAADRVGAELMGVDFGKIGYLSFCAQAGDRGQSDLGKIEILGPPIKDHAKTYQLPKQWDQITSWQKPMIAG